MGTARPVPGWGRAYFFLSLPLSGLMNTGWPLIWQRLMTSISEGATPGHVDQAEGVMDLDGADLAPGQVGLAGDGPDDVAGADALFFAQLDQQPGRFARHETGRGLADGAQSLMFARRVHPCAPLSAAP